MSIMCQQSVATYLRTVVGISKINRPLLGFIKNTPHVFPEDADSQQLNASHE